MTTTDHAHSVKEAESENKEVSSRPSLEANQHNKPADIRNFQSDETMPGLSEVNDIPAQESIEAPQSGYLAGTTISSGDNMGETTVQEETDEEKDEDLIVMGTEADISAEDLAILEGGEEYMPSRDDDALKQAALDNVDNEGDPLNEMSFGEDLSGKDLDLPDDIETGTNESPGEEDEENDYYSLGGDRQDQLEEKNS